MKDGGASNAGLAAAAACTKLKPEFAVASLNWNPPPPAGPLGCAGVGLVVCPNANPPDGTGAEAAAALPLNPCVLDWAAPKTHQRTILNAFQMLPFIPMQFCG